ncbi:hypothetical protein EV2_029736 [Malus domestica]
MSIVLGQEEVGWMLLLVVLWAVVVARLSHHYSADAAQGTSNTAAKEYRRQWRKFTAQGGISEKQDHLKRKITTDGTSYTADKVEKYRQRRGVTLLGRNVPNPIRIFDDSGFPRKVIQEFSKPGFVRPTPIQAQVWPMAL